MNRLRRELGLFDYAVQLLTRLPVPATPTPAPDALARSAKYFPLVGMVVGAIAGLVLLLSSFGLKDALPALLAAGTGIVVTGAFHEDGLADTADGLGGGSTPARRLAIMKDSRIGTFGVLAVGLVVAIKVAALAAIGPATDAAAALIAAHAGARGAAVIVMARLRYVGVLELAKLKPTGDRVTRGETLIAIVLALLPLLFVTPASALYGVTGGALLALWPALTARKLVGGYTGDILGAVEQAYEAGFLVGVTIAYSAL